MASDHNAVPTASTRRAAEAGAAAGGTSAAGAAGAGAAEAGGRREVPAEEIRLAVVLNGGVSLAVWMGGASVELNRFAHGRGVYGSLLRLAGCRGRIDVIAGTSAGGINGAALALAQANSTARLEELRDVWTDQGQIDTLLRRPFRGSPTSLLQGDEYFLPRLNEAMQRLTTPYQGTVAEEHPIDLTITTTLLNGAQKVSVDSTGQRLPQWVHDGRFHFRRTEGSDPFSAARIATTADQLALAARCTASFPVAFEPAFVPVNRAAPDSLAAMEAARLHPDMGDVASWAGGNRDEPGWEAADESSRVDVSRFAVDGGLLANMPTRSALAAVDSMPAGRPVRRVMILVHPHAPSEQLEQADDPTRPPTLTASMGAMLGALTAQGSRTFVEQIEQHNLTAAGRRGTRSDILRTVENATRLQTLAASVFEQYRRLRMWRAGRDVAQFALPQQGWNTDRIRRNARRAQEQWYAGRKTAQGSRPPLPYVPSGLKSASGTGWAWGVSAAVGVADAAADLLRRMVWVLPASEEYDAVMAARERVSLLRQQIQQCRELTDRMWRRDPVLSRLEPTETLFALRLAWYEWAMVGSADPNDLRDLRGQITKLIADVGEHEAARSPAGSDAAGRAQTVRNSLYAHLLGEGQQTGGPMVHSAAVGDRVADLVGQVVAAMRSVLPVLSGLSADARTEVDPELAAWGRIFGRTATEADLLHRLLALEVATTALGDENTTEYSLPLELVQLSAQTANGFATASRSADDKLGGMAISRFGGFLKRSWRLNDWAWGRMDAATVLCRLVLDPARLRRRAELTGLLVPGADPQQLAGQVFDGLAAELFGPAGSDADGPPIPDWAGLRAGALAELVEVYSEGAVGDLPPTMPSLAELAAWAIHLRAITEELPALGRAVRADAIAGANPRSNSELLVAEHADLIRRLDEIVVQAGGAEPDTFTEAGLRDAVLALRAFDRAGVGRESLREEGTSDQMLRTATSAAAVAATLIDSDDSGLAAVKPVTRSLRGGMLLPYWVITGLTAGGAISRALALLGLSIGAVLMALALFGALPGWASGVGAAVGASALLVSFAYGALRTGTMLHGIVLLSPVVPLLAYAVQQSREGSMDASAAQGAATLLAVVGLALGLMLLGSLPAPMLSVWGELDRVADKAGIPGVPADIDGSRLGSAQAWRRIRALGALLFRPFGVVVAVAAVGVAIVLAVNTGAWVDLAEWVVENRAATASIVAGILVLGMFVSWREGRSLRIAYDASASYRTDVPVWRFHPVRHPAGVTVGWSALYGSCYLLLAAFLLWDPWEWLPTWWGKALLTTALLFAVALLLVVPVLLPWRAKRRIEEAEQGYAYEQLRLGRAGLAGGADTRGLSLTRRGKRLAGRIGDEIDSSGWSAEDLAGANERRVLRDLIERGRGYHFLVKTSAVTAQDWLPSAWGADSVSMTFGRAGTEQR